MIEPPHLDRGNGSGGGRSQLALELFLNAYAGVAALLIARCLMKIETISPRVWTGRTVYRLTDPLLTPLNLLPGADHRLIGGATLADLTALFLLLVIPLWLITHRRFS